MTLESLLNNSSVLLCGPGPLEIDENFIDENVEDVVSIEPNVELILQVRHKITLQPYPNTNFSRSKLNDCGQYKSSITYRLYDKNDDLRNSIWFHEYRWGIEWSGKDSRKKQIIDIISTKNFGKLILFLDDEFKPISRLADIILKNNLINITVDDDTDKQFELIIPSIKLFPGITMTLNEVGLSIIVSKEQINVLKNCVEEVITDPSEKIQTYVKNLKDIMKLRASKFNKTNMTEKEYYSQEFRLLDKIYESCDLDEEKPTTLSYYFHNVVVIIRSAILKRVKELKAKCGFNHQ